MNKELFEQLQQSIKEAVSIAEGEMRPSRVFKAVPTMKCKGYKVKVSRDD